MGQGTPQAVQKPWVQSKIYFYVLKTISQRKWINYKGAISQDTKLGNLIWFLIGGNIRGLFKLGDGKS